MHDADAAEETSKKAVIAAAAREAELKWEREAAARREAKQQAWSKKAAQMRATDAAAKASRAAEHLALEEQVARCCAGNTSSLALNTDPPEGSLKSPPKLLVPATAATAQTALVVEDVPADDEYSRLMGRSSRTTQTSSLRRTSSTKTPSQRPVQILPLVQRPVALSRARLLSPRTFAPPCLAQGCLLPSRRSALVAPPRHLRWARMPALPSSQSLPRPTTAPPNIPEGGRRSTLRESRYEGVVHNKIPENEWEELDQRAWRIETLRAGKPGRSWLCELNLLHKDGVSATDLLLGLLGGMRASFEIASAAIPEFCYLPLDEQSPLPPLTITAEGSSFPETCAAAYPDVKCWNLRTQASSDPPSHTPPAHSNGASLTMILLTQALSSLLHRSCSWRG